LNDYNRIAPFYDRLKKLVFGEQLDLASNYHLSKLTGPAKILIVGGGTGSILTNISSIHSVDYVDQSSNMIDLAKARKFTCDVTFQTSTFENYDTTLSYDVIIFPFFLDMFTKKELEDILKKSKQLLKDNGSIHISDFVAKNSGLSVFQKLLLTSIFVFFRITTQHRLFKIINTQPLLQKLNFQPVTEKSFVSGMVVASVWKIDIH